MNTFGFIGCGNMGGALASAIAKTVAGEQIVLCDASVEKAQALSKKLGACAKNAKAAHFAVVALPECENTSIRCGTRMNYWASFL